MKIIDGIKLKGRPVEIPDCSRYDLPQFFVEMGFKTGVEIGVYKGEYTKELAKAGLKVFGVDPWKIYEDYDTKYKKHGPTQEKCDALYESAKQLLSFYPDVTLIRKTSMEAANDFRDNSIDFVYIDGHHGFKYVAEDLWEWTKKVRPGGVVSGHDYVIFKGSESIYDPYVCQVPYVVDAFTKCLGLSDWYLLGNKHPLANEKRDKWRSWMFIK